MLTVSGLFIYPVKSLSGIAVNSAAVTSRGLQHDRRMMLVDNNNIFLTQRAHPLMALLQPVMNNNGLFIQHKQNKIAPIFIPFNPPGNDEITVTVWDDTCQGLPYHPEINEWFSTALGLDCRLVYMPESSVRPVDKRYALDNELTSFSDGYPTLLISQASLDDLNNRLDKTVPMNRFRPNIVLSGGAAFLEDQLRFFCINGIKFYGVKPCARCVMTTIDQETIERSKEPLRTLATYRLKEKKILFGQNLLHHGQGTITIGDTIEVREYQPAAI